MIRHGGKVPGDIGEDMDDRTHSHVDESMNFHVNVNK